jgi:hypothetical protein
MNILCFSDINWDFPWSRNQQIMTRFPDHWKIIYVQPSFIRLLIGKPLRAFPRHVRKNIIAVSFPIIPFFDRLAIVRKINRFLIVFWARFFVALYNFKDPNIIIYEPRFSCVIGKIRDCLVCYKVLDDRMEFLGIPRWINDNIDFLTDKADIIVTSSLRLFDKFKRNKEQDIFLVGNGVEVEHFKKARDNIEIPEDMNSLEKPILGYIGTIGEWFDFKLIEGILLFYPNISIVLIGPIFPKQKVEIDRLKKAHSNFFALGKKPYDILPNYIKGFDACIIPFKINKLTLSVNPNKLYEYLAGGKPVISVALPELRKYKDIVYLAENHDEFIFQVKTALTSKHDLKKFMKIAEENTWDDKAKIVVDLIEKYTRKVCV